MLAGVTGPTFRFLNRFTPQSVSPPKTSITINRQPPQPPSAQTHHGFPPPEGGGAYPELWLIVCLSWRLERWRVPAPCAIHPAAAGRGAYSEGGRFIVPYVRRAFLGPRSVKRKT